VTEKQFSPQAAPLFPRGAPDTVLGVIGKWVFSVFVIPAGRMMMLPDARAAFLKHFALREAHARGAAVTGGPIISRANSGAGAATFR
jgi:hypothetical protein